MNIRYLNFLAQNEHCLPTLKSVLSDPTFVVWQDLTADRFWRSFELLRMWLAQNAAILNLLEKHLLSEYLLYRSAAPDQMNHWLKQTIDISAHFDDSDWASMVQGRWDAIPVWLTASDAHRICFIIGVSDSPKRARLWPQWADALLDAAARDAIRNAVTAIDASAYHLYCYPLTVANNVTQIKGASLGLPLAMGFRRLLDMAPQPMAMACSGVLSPDGRVERVGALDKKIALAQTYGYKMFLYPAANRPPASAPAMEMLPVATLSEAQMFSALYRPGRSWELMLLSQIIGNADLFLANCMNLSLPWLQWAHQQGKLKTVIKESLASPSRMNTLIDKLGQSADSGLTARAHFLARLISYKQINRVRRLAPLSTFKFCQFNITLANHAGDVATAEKWTKRAEVLVQDASPADLETYSDFSNHKFMIQHNRYHFDPQLPSDLKMILNHLEQRWNLDCQFKTCTSLPLGRLYGAAAQNYGFCGQTYTDQVEKYTALAQKAFGYGVTPEYDADARRQFNYRMYAHLDAGQSGQAESDLYAYLGIRDWHDPAFEPGRFSPWEHAALMRFLAEKPNAAIRSIYFRWALSAYRTLITPHHPWQLWCFNLARLAEQTDDVKTAVAFYHKSLQLCLNADQGPTIHIMALLPLAALDGLKAHPPVQQSETAVSQIKKAARRLNPAYFKMITTGNFNSLLEKIKHQPQLWFPFAYR